MVLREDDRDDIINILEWDDDERAREYVVSLKLREAMQRSMSNVATLRVTVHEHVMESDA